MVVPRGDVVGYMGREELPRSRLILALHLLLRGQRSGPGVVAAALLVRVEGESQRPAPSKTQDGKGETCEEQEDDG